MNKKTLFSATSLNQFIFITAFVIGLTSCSSHSSLLDHSFLGGHSGQHTVSYQPENPAFWQGSTQTVWERLQMVPEAKLAEIKTLDDASRAAWIKLALISQRDSTNTPDLVRDLLAWRKDYPQHPGNALFPNDATLTSLSTETPPRNITLLLPLEGQFSSSGKAVRDGFLSAYYEMLAKSHYQQSISFLSTNKNTNITSLYQDAVNKGASIVIGPLLKDNVMQLSHNSSFPVPTLALNYTDSLFGGLPTNFYQFGLSPKDETKEVADTASEGGHSHALIIAPQNAWGQRVVTSLTERWKANGGQITEVYYFTPQSDLAKDIPALLHINTAIDNKKSHDIHENTKDNLEKQRRHDFDVVFLLAPPQSARQIMPLLRFYYVDNVPIYGTSVVYSGKPDPQKDIDLNGLQFADIPWIIHGNPSTALDADTSNRLFAVGRDAYLISHELHRFSVLPNFPLYGATGMLTLESSHQFRRQLSMAEIHDGHL